MPPLRQLLKPSYPWRFLRSRLQRTWLRRYPNYRGACLFEPGHFYSPLLDLQAASPGTRCLPYDGVECWEQVPLYAEAQRQLYMELMAAKTAPAFPRSANPGSRYFHDNDWFPLADALLLSGLLCQQRPRRIMEVGSGFSTAVMLDTLDHSGLNCDITCIEPHPDRLKELLVAADWQRLQLLNQPVQEVSVTAFDALEAGDFLFIDSSHVAKAGSDVSHLFLRILPRLRPGVWVHVHDVFYPESYPMSWIQEGRAWNESLFLRVMLVGQSGWEIRAFNHYAATSMGADFWNPQPAFQTHPGCSFWMQRR